MGGRCGGEVRTRVRHAHSLMDDVQQQSTSGAAAPLRPHATAKALPLARTAATDRHADRSHVAPRGRTGQTS